MVTTPSTSSAPKRRRIDIGDLLQPVSTQAPSGTSLKYDLIYDEIRQARQEDDPRLSMGIWKTDLKKADWNKIENLCIEALKTRTKDIQISTWLAEAWTCLDGLDGYNHGILLLLELSTTFWETLHPQALEDGDMENRYNIFDWADSTLSNRLLMIPLTQSKLDQSSYGLGYYKSAQHRDAASRRVEPSRAVPMDPNKSIGILEDFQKSMEQTPDAFLYEQQSQISESIDVTNKLKNRLSELFTSNTPGCLKLLGTLKEMDRMLKSTLQTRPPAPSEQPANSVLSSEPEVVNVEQFATQEELVQEKSQPPLPSIQALSTREDAYLQLKVIANFLAQHEPQSLVPQLLQKLISWEHKNIVEVLSQIAKTPEEYELLMRILGNPTNPE
jgi:type VI secretion system ImpA family protein